MEQTNKPVVRIPYKHTIFVTEVIRHGDKEKAYSKAYPGAQPKSRKPAACRLYNRPEIKQLIDEGRAEATEKAIEKAKQEGVDIMTDEFVSLHEIRRELSRIIRKQERMIRYDKFKDRVEEKEVIVDNPNIRVRAMTLYARLSKDILEKQAEATPGKLDPNNLPEGYITRTHSYDGNKAFSDKYADLTDEEYDHLIKLSLTDPDIRVMQPRLTPMMEKAGCWVERDPETGKYEVVCPEENIGMLKWPPDLDADTKQVTFINKDTTQNTDDQSIEEKKQCEQDHGQETPDNHPDQQNRRYKKTIKIICNGVTSYKEIELPYRETDTP